MLRELQSLICDRSSELRELQSYLQVCKGSLEPHWTERDTANASACLDTLEQALHRTGVLIEGMADIEQQMQRSGERDPWVRKLVSHSLRQSIHALTALLETIREGAGETHHAHTALSSVIASLASVVDDIAMHQQLLGGKVASQQFPFAPLSIIEEIVDRSWSRITAKNLELMLVCDPAVPATVMGDEGRFRQIMVTLLESALRLTSEGSIRIGVRYDDESSHPLCVEVVDTGAGFSQSEDGRIVLGLKPDVDMDIGDMVRTELRLIQEVIEHLSGEMIVESRIEAGTSIRVNLALANAGSERVGRLALLSEAASVSLFPADSAELNAVKRSLDTLGVPYRGVDSLSLLPNANEHALLFVGESGLVEWNQWCGDPSNSLLYAVFVPSLGAADGRSFRNDASFSHTLESPALTGRVRAVIEAFADPDRSSIRESREPSKQVDFCNVLIVEDDPISAMVLKHLLEKMNCRATVADGGREALHKLSVEAFELIFMDCVMPGMDGFETTERIRTEAKSSVPVVAVTASLRADTRSNCLRSGMNDVLAKPVSSGILASTIERWLGNKAHTGAERSRNLREHQQLLAYPDDVFQEVLQLWLDLHGVWLVGIRQAIHAGDRNRALEDAYHLRVGLSVMGVEHLYTELRQLEENVKSNRWVQAQQQMGGLSEQIADINTTVDACLKAFEDGGADDAAQGVDSNAKPPRGRVVIVLEEHAMVRAVTKALQKDGLQIEACASLELALHRIETLGSEQIACVVCSENAVGTDGLGDCRRLLEKDASLSVVVIAHFPTKSLVNAAIKAGVFDVLAKPCEYELLQATIARGLLEAQRKRQLRSTQHAALRIGSAQTRLLAQQSGTLETIQAQVFNLPKQEAGGDFWVHFQPAPKRHCFYMTDVSGHDIEAAFVSAYFHGMIRGSRHLGNLGMQEALQEFNRFLSREWNASDPSSKAVTVEKSIACCAADLDLELGLLTFYLCGCCLPVILEKDGAVHVAARNTGTPLGWFDDCDIVRAQWQCSEICGFYVWSDGVDALACELGVSEMTVAHMLMQQASNAGSQPDWLLLSRDDLLAAYVSEAVSQEAKLEQCVFFVEYAGDRWEEIDAIQTLLKQSLLLLNPGFDEALLYDLMLCYREGMLNALQHGCQRRNDRYARATLCIDKEGSLYKLRIWDDGDPNLDGTFDVKKHHASSHRGLSLMRAFSKEIRFHRDRKHVEMVFCLPNQSSSITHEAS